MDALDTFFLITLTILSAFGAAVLQFSAKRIAKISNTTYLKSFIICMISGFISFVLLLCLFGKGVATEDGMKLLAKTGFGPLFILNMFILTLVYVSIGKLIWKCAWVQSTKANAPWIIIYSLFAGYIYSNFY